MELLQKRGVEVPRSLTVLEIKARLAELSGTRAPPNAMDEKLVALKKATKKKSELLEFMKQEGIEVGANQTMAQMYARGQQVITERHEPSGSEKVNFGKYAEKSFLELKVEQPSLLDF